MRNHFSGVFRVMQNTAMTACLISAGSMALADGRVQIMVFDASGSMWNRMDGDLTRIEIARDVMREFFGSRDASVPLSVIAYGHRRRGDCGDIEVIAPLGQHASGPLAATIEGLNPRGMTPLTDSLILARDQIPATAEAADIILVTDGLENCGGDPCALAAQLAAEGIDIRAHVVGFGLTRAEVDSLSCLPEMTGGMLFQTNSGTELAEAMAMVSTPEPEPAPASLTFRAVDARNGAPLAPVTWQVEALATGAQVAPAATQAELSLELPDGSYRIGATHPGFAGAIELQAQAGMTGLVDVPLDKILATLIVEGIDAETGLALQGVEWTVINLSDESAQTHTAQGPRQAYLLNPGEYRIEGVLGARSGGSNASATLDEDRSVTIRLAETLPDASIAGPQEIPAGAQFEVTWTGPDAQNDYVTIVAAGAPQDAYNDYARTRRGSPATLTAPDAVGAYELRYVLNEGRRVLASQPVTLVPVTAALIAPDEAVAGAQIEVQWQGPDNNNDYITVVEVGAPEGSYNHYARTRRGNPATLTLPDGLGNYEIRYVLNQSGRTLASLPVTVGAGEVSLDVEGEVEPGGVVTVVWQGPGRYEDFIQIVAEDSPDNAAALREARASQGSPLQLFAPAQAGRYELRYRASDSGDVLARIPLQVGK